MKLTTEGFFRRAMLGTLGMAGILAIAATGPGTKDHQPAALPSALPLALGKPAPVVAESAGVEWNGNTYHLVKLDSIRFDLDNTNRLTAEIQAEVTSFDEVAYDISGAVFDAAGNLLGTARAQCRLERMWLGRVMHSPRTIGLDFGISLDYPRATAFMLGVSKRKVLTPDQW